MSPTNRICLLLCVVSLSVAGCGRKSQAPLREAQKPLIDNSDKVAPPPADSAIERIGNSPIHIETKPDEIWTHETIHDRIKPQLKRMIHVLEQDRFDPAQLSGITSDQFSSKSLRPERLLTVYDESNIKILRADGQHQASCSFDNLPAALRQLTQPMAGMTCRTELKVVGVELSGQGIIAKIRCQISATDDQKRIQQNSRWTTRWRMASQGTILLEQLDVDQDSFEEIEHASPEGIFVDATRYVFGSSEFFQRQLLPGTSFWLNRLDSSLGLDIVALHGIAMGDFNNDGLDDVYLCMPAGLPNRLLQHSVDGRVTDVSAEWGVDFLDFSRHALFIDFDNDGDQDLAVHLNASIIFMQNDGRRFWPRKEIRLASASYSLCAADFDHDGLVDVFVTCRESFAVDGKRRNVLGQPVPYHDANNGSPNVLLRNKGRFDFEDVTEQTGIAQNNHRFSYAAAWEDFDNDGDQDLYVANDFGRNNLYQNQDGRFQDIAERAGVEDISAGMSVVCADFNLDGHQDIYVGNMYSSAGNRIAYQNHFHQQANEQTRGQYRRHARGNTLFQNEANGFFSDISIEAGANMGRWAWSCNDVDINNDGLPDLIVANGFVSNDDQDDL